MNKSLRPINLTLIIVILFFSCSKKTISTVPTPASVAAKPVLNVQDIQFEYFHGKARMVLRDANKEREVKANIRVRKDSVIWMTFSVIGVQGGKALINKDSITIVSNVDKEYYVFEYEELSKRYNFKIDYEIIQSAMLGNLLFPRKDDDVIIEESSMFLLKQHANTVDIINYVNAASMKVEKIDMKENNTNNSLVINYSNFQPVQDRLFPYNGTISLFYKTMAGVLNTTVIFEYNKAEVGDKELKFPFNIPKRYVRR
jgi:hypothetical protein